MNEFPRAKYGEILKSCPGRSSIEVAAPWTHGPFELAPPWTLLSQQMFAAEILWKDGAPCAGRLGIVLYGYKQRPVC